MNTFVKNTINVIGTLLTMVVIFFTFMKLGLYLADQRNAAIARNRGVAEAEVIGTSYYKGYRVKLAYNVNDVVYESRFRVRSRGYIGEYYRVEYDTTKPSRASLIGPEIFFKPDQETAFTDGVALRVFPDSGRYPFVRFSYAVNGKEYEREQNFYDVSAFKEGGIYRVEYLLDEPRKGILRLPMRGAQ